MIYESLHEDLRRAIDKAVAELPLRVREPVQGVEFTTSIRDEAREIIAHHICPVPGVTVRLLEQIRGEGWSVAVHNDYRQGGKQFTFWLFTHWQSHKYLKGEGLTDREALQQVWNEIEREGTDGR